MSNTGKLILVFSHFHITEIVCVAVNFTCRVQMMQMYFNVNNFMDTFEKNITLSKFHNQIYLEGNPLISDKQAHKFVV